MQPANSVPNLCHCAFLEISPAISPSVRRTDLHSRFYSYTNYARLVMFSFGFQQAFERGLEAKDEVFFTRVGILLHRARVS